MTVGRYLRAQREARGEELDQVADMLRIHRAYLQAIEADDVDRLPGPTYAVGFVRAYAEHLDLDGAKVVERFKEETKGLETRTQLVFPSPLPEGRVPSGAILLLAMVFLAAAYGGWMYVSSLDTSLAEMVPSLPERFAAFVGSDSPAAPEAPPAVVPGAAGRSDGGKPAETPSGDTVPPSMAPDHARPAPDDSSSTIPADAPAVGSSEPAAASSGDAASPSIGTTESAAGAGTESPPPAADSAPASYQTAVATADSTAATAVTDESGNRGATPASTPPSGDTASAAATSTQSHATGGEAHPQAGQPSRQATLPVAAETLTAEPSVTPVSTTAEATATAVTGRGAAKYPPDPPLPTFRETPKVFGAENEAGRVVILAVGDSWVEVRDRSGALLLTRVLRTGDRYRVPDQPGLTLVTGNAGGLEISVDGTPVPSLGPVGTVRRNVALDPQALKSGTAHLN